MVGAIATNLHEGSRSEYLAQYIFASFGTAVAVPHHEDTGVDLYCTLMEPIGSRAWPRAYFAVQVKSTRDSWVLGGVESVRWLVEHPLPLFLCVVDKRGARIRVYHTSPRFYAWSHPPLSDRLELVPTTESEGECTQWKGSNTFSVAPVVDASLGQLLQDDFRGNTKKVLRSWIDIDMANLDLLKEGIHSFRMPYKYEANSVPSGEEGWVTQGTTRAESIERVLNRVKESVAYLADQLFNRGDLAGAARCAILLRHLYKGDTSGITHNPFLHQAINKLVQGQEKYLFSGVDALSAKIDEMLTNGSHQEPT